MKTLCTLIATALLAGGISRGQDIATQQEPTTPVPKRSVWYVNETVSPIDDSRNVTMMLSPIESDAKTPTILMLRWVEKKLEVMVRGGGYIGSGDYPKLTIRWDSSPAKDVFWNASATGDATFAASPGEFIQQALKSRKVVIRVHEFRAPATPVYDVSGLAEKLDKYPEIKVAIAASAKKTIAERIAEQKKRDQRMAEIDAFLAKHHVPQPKQSK